MLSRSLEYREDGYYSYGNYSYGNYSYGNYSYGGYNSTNSTDALIMTTMMDYDLYDIKYDDEYSTTDKYG